MNTLAVHYRVCYSSADGLVVLYVVILLLPRNLEPHCVVSRKEKQDVSSINVELNKTVFVDW